MKGWMDGVCGMARAAARTRPSGRQAARGGSRLCIARRHPLQAPSHPHKHTTCAPPPPHTHTHTFCCLMARMSPSSLRHAPSAFTFMRSSSARRRSCRACAHTTRMGRRAWRDWACQGSSHARRQGLQSWPSRPHGEPTPQPHQAHGEGTAHSRRRAALHPHLGPDRLDLFIQLPDAALVLCLEAQPLVLCTHGGEGVCGRRREAQAGRHVGGTRGRAGQGCAGNESAPPARPAAPASRGAPAAGQQQGSVSQVPLRICRLQTEKAIAQAAAARHPPEAWARASSLASRSRRSRCSSSRCAASSTSLSSYLCLRAAWSAMLCMAACLAAMARSSRASSPASRAVCMLRAGGAQEAGRERQLSSPPAPIEPQPIHPKPRPNQAQARPSCKLHGIPCAASWRTASWRCPPGPPARPPASRVRLLLRRKLVVVQLQLIQLAPAPALLPLAVLRPQRGQAEGGGVAGAAAIDSRRLLTTNAPDSLRRGRRRRAAAAKRSTLMRADVREAAMCRAAACRALPAHSAAPRCP